MKNNKTYIFFITFSAITLNFIIGSIFPALSFLICIILFSVINDKNNIIYNIICTSFFGAIVYSSRIFSINESDDYIRYYDTFVNINRISSSVYFDEPGLYWFYKVVSYFIPNLSISGLSFITLFSSLVLIGFFFYRLCFYNLKIKYVGLFFSIIYLLLSIDYMNQLVRQSIAMIFISFSLLNISKIKKVIFSLLALTFHFSSIPVILILYALRKTSIKKIILFSIISTIIILICLNIPLIKNYLARLEIYNINSFEINWYMKYVVFILLLSIVSKPLYQNKEWGHFLLTLALLVIITAPLGLLSLRLFLIYIVFFLGVHLYVISENNKIILVLIIILLFSMKTINILTPNDHKSDNFSLWYNYGIYSSEPFYYFSKY